MSTSALNWAVNKEHVADYATNEAARPAFSLRE
jgi:hypothetical protein